SSKSLRAAARVFDRLVEAGFDRSCALLALGGGVAGDLGGFVAATFLRGIAWVSAPTTLLAQVDASIGGKTGINFRAKNLIGAVHQPAVVLADPDTLRSLPPRQLRSGMAEVVKTGVIGAPDLFDYVESHAAECRRGDPAALEWIVARCAAYKADVVARGEREAGPRMVLNYGHTFGHAIEAAASYRGLTHGEAISVGMTLEARLAVRLGLCAPALLDRQTRLLEALGLPVRRAALSRRKPPAPRAVRAAMAHDKKAAAGRLRPSCRDRKSTRLNSSHLVISYAVFCLRKKKVANTSRTAKLRWLSASRCSQGAMPPIDRPIAAIGSSARAKGTAAPPSTGRKSPRASRR